MLGKEFRLPAKVFALGCGRDLNQQIAICAANIFWRKAPRINDQVRRGEGSAAFEAVEINARLAIDPMGLIKPITQRLYKPALQPQMRRVMACIGATSPSSSSNFSSSSKIPAAIMAQTSLTVKPMRSSFSEGVVSRIGMG